MTPPPQAPWEVQNPNQTPTAPPTGAYPPPPTGPPTSWPAGQVAPGVGQATPSPSASSGATTLFTTRNLQILVGGGIALMFISSFLPWARVWILTVNGLDGDGKLTALCSIIAAVLFGVGIKQFREGKNGNGWYVGSLIASVITAGIYVYDFINVSTVASEPDDFIEVSASPSTGLILGPLAGIATIVGLVMVLRKRPSTTQSAPAPPGR